MSQAASSSTLRPSPSVDASLSATRRAPSPPRTHVPMPLVSDLLHEVRNSLAQGPTAEEVDHVFNQANLSESLEDVKNRCASLRNLWRDTNAAVAKSLERCEREMEICRLGGVIIPRLKPCNLEEYGLPLRVMADSYLIDGALDNFTRNAVRERGDPKVVVKIERQTPVEVFVSFEVTDMGGGFCNRLGEKRNFEKLDLQKVLEETPIKDNGIGMPRADRAITAMGGKLLISSEANVGSTLQFTLRLKKIAIEVQPIVIPTPLSPHFLFQRHAVLVVDDNNINAKVVVRNLKHFHVKSAVADSGARALALCAAKSFDLILMDFGLGDGSGTDFTKQILQISKNRKVVVVGLTGSPEQADEGIAAGMKGVIGKPFKIDELSKIFSLRRKIPSVAMMPPLAYDPSQSPASPPSPRPNHPLPISPTSIPSYPSSSSSATSPASGPVSIKKEDSEAKDL